MEWCDLFGAWFFGGGPCWVCEGEVLLICVVVQQRDRGARWMSG